MQAKSSSKARTLENIDFLIFIGDFKLLLSLPKSTTVGGLLNIVKGYEALHQEHGPQGQSFMGLGSFNNNPLVDYWLTQSSLDFTRFKRKLQLKTLYCNERRSEKLSLADFQFLVCLGKGACGEVYLVRSKVCGSVFALKRLKKQAITNFNSMVSLFGERKSMIQLGTNPYTVTLHASFQSASHFNFLLEYCPGGEMFLHISSQNNRLTLDDMRLYFCEILLAMEFIHKKKVLYRDLKPQNIFVDIKGHLKIGDFGLSKCNFQQDDFALSVCGSADYMAPEVLENKDYNFSADFYSIGAILYEFLTGYPPYYGEQNDKERLRLMKNMGLQLQKVIQNHELRQLLSNLLDPDPDRRISNFQEIKNSPWLAKVDWKAVEARAQSAAFAPDPMGVYIGRQFLDQQDIVDEMNFYFEDEIPSTQITEAFQYIRPESRKILGLEGETAQGTKAPKQKPSQRVDKKHGKKTNLSVALFDKEDTTESSSTTQVRTSKHSENKENLFPKKQNHTRGMMKQTSHHILLLSNKGTITNNSITLAAQKSQRSLIINSHNSSECSIKHSKASSKSKDIRQKGDTSSRSKGGSKDKTLKGVSLSKAMKKKDEKKVMLPTCSFKIKLT